MIDLKNIIYHRTDTWPSYKDLEKETNIEIANFIKKIYREGVFIEIEKLISCEEFKVSGNDYDYCCVGIGHIVLLAICSAIDSLGAYAEGTGIRNVGPRFKNFISTYFLSSYDEELAEKIYDSFRCGIVHEWYLFKGSMIGMENDPNHLREENGILHISLNDFFKDLKAAFKDYYEKIKSDKSIKKKLLKRYKEIKGG